MIDRVEKAYYYLLGYCDKHKNCGSCRFSDEEGLCVLAEKIPVDWPNPKPRLPRLIGFEREGQK